MGTNLRALVAELWRDDRGLVSLEYMLLGTIVTLGMAGGLASLRDAAAGEMKEYGSGVREVIQSYRAQVPQGTSAVRGPAGQVGTHTDAARVAP
jgi:Flp pilus assembly pilin Flp